MIIHGVNESERLKLSNIMKFLSEQMRKADRILSY
jgi:hypothetical protein